jgi:predicted DNA-binding transcriptional regulator YafY
VRYGKTRSLLKLALCLAATAEGLTLDEMAAELGASKRTAERMRDALRDLFPAMEEIWEPPYRRFRIPGGLGRLFQTPTVEELVELGKVAESLRAIGAEPRASALTSLERKIGAAMRDVDLLRLGPDVEALRRAEIIPVYSGPRPFEDEGVIALVRRSIMAGRALRFRYRGGAREGEARDVTPYGVMFGRANYLVAAELGSEAPHSYRFDRMESLELLDLPASPPGEFQHPRLRRRLIRRFPGRCVRHRAADSSGRGRGRPSLAIPSPPGGGARGGRLGDRALHRERRS